MIPGNFTGDDLWLQVFATRNGEEQRASNGPIRPVAAPSLATTGSVVISEINYQSSPQFDPGDWFEVVNTEDFPLSLAGWSVRDSNQENLTTLGDLVIQPGEGMVFAADSFLFTGAFSTIPPPNQVLNFNLSANGDRIALFDPVSRMKDEVEYVSAPPGRTLRERINPYTHRPLGRQREPVVLDCRALWRNSLRLWGLEPGLAQVRCRGGTGPWSHASSGNTTLLLTVISSVAVEICIYDVAGRAVLEPVIMDLQAGSHSVTLDTKDLPSGVYFAAVRNMGYLQAVKVTLIGDR